MNYTSRATKLLLSTVVSAYRSRIERVHNEALTNQILLDVPMGLHQYCQRVRRSCSSPVRVAPRLIKTGRPTQPDPTFPLPGSFSIARAPIRDLAAAE